MQYLYLVLRMPARATSGEEALRPTVQLVGEGVEIGLSEVPQVGAFGKCRWPAAVHARSTHARPLQFVRHALGGADDEGAGGFGDVGCESVQFVDPHDPLDLGEQAFDEAEVAAGDAGDGGDGLSIGEVVLVEIDAEGAPASGQDEGQFLGTEGPVVVGVPEEALFDAGHSAMRIRP